MNLSLEAIGSWMQSSSATNRRRNKLNPTLAADVNVLEHRALLAADVSGTWYIRGQSTNIQQSGTEVLLTNESAQVTTGRFINGNQIVADQWGGIIGTVSGDRISWSNNSVWTRTQEAIPNISGTWYFGNQGTTISQSGTILTLTNEQGTTAQGRFLSGTQIIADGWDGLRGTVVNNGTIAWVNGDTWTRAPGAPNPSTPTLAATWTAAANGGTARVASDGHGGLTFTSVSGGRSGGYLTDSTHVYASAWGLTGTLNSSSNPSRITWSNGSVWNVNSSSSSFAVPPLSANWIAAANGGTARVASDGNGGLIFTNTSGSRSYGYYSTGTQVYASDWGITGTLNSATNPTRITWSNGSVWNA